MSDLKRAIVIGVAVSAAIFASCDESSLVGTLTTPSSGGNSVGVGGEQGGGTATTPIGTGGGLIGPAGAVSSSASNGVGGAGGLGAGSSGGSGPGGFGGAGGH